MTQRNIGDSIKKMDSQYEKFDHVLGMIEEYIDSGKKITKSTVYKDQNIGLKWYHFKNRYKRRIGVELKTRCSALSDYELEKLLAIPQFESWSKNANDKKTKYVFKRNLKLCMEYEKAYGKLPVDIECQIDGTCVKLYKWLDMQKEKYKVMIGKSKYKYSHLSEYELGALKQWSYFNDWIHDYENKKTLSFNQYVNLCQNYLVTNKVDDISCNNTTEHDGQKIRIGYWYSRQKLRCKKTAGLDIKVCTSLTSAELNALLILPSFRRWFNDFVLKTPNISFNFQSSEQELDSTEITIDSSV